MADTTITINPDDDDPNDARDLVDSMFDALLVTGGTLTVNIKREAPPDPEPEDKWAKWDWDFIHLNDELNAALKETNETTRNKLGVSAHHNLSRLKDDLVGRDKWDGFAQRKNALIQSTRRLLADVFGVDVDDGEQWDFDLSSITTEIEKVLTFDDLNLKNRKGVEIHNRIERLKEGYAALPAEAQTAERREGLIEITTVLLRDVFSIPVTEFTGRPAAHVPEDKGETDA